MEMPQNPNEALTPFYTGDRIIYIPVTEYYLFVDHPELAMARLALLDAMERDTTDQTNL